MVRAEKEKAVFLVYVTALLCLAGVHTPGLSPDSPWWHRLAYPFVHANIFHLLGNVYCIILLAFRWGQSVLSLVLSYLIAICVPVLWPGTVVGASGVCYAMMGWDLWKVARRGFFLAWIGAFILIGFVVPAFAGFVHLWCFVLGVIVGRLCRRK